MGRSPLRTLSLALVLAGCGKAGERPPAEAERARGSRPPPALLGEWVGGAPVVYRGGGVRTETSQTRVVYRPDRSFSYIARLTMSGGRMPPEGLAFSLEARGQWSLAGNQLTERFTAARVRPMTDASPVLELVAQTISDEALAKPPSRSELLVADAARLVLRDLETNETVTYKRAERLAN